MKTEIYIGSFDDSMLPDKNEFAKRYSGSLLMLEGEKVPKGLYKFQGFGYALGETKYIFTGLEGKLFLNEKTDASVSVVYPKRGAFNVPHVCMYAARVPSRQWKRGLCSDNVKVFNLVQGRKAKAIVAKHTEAALGLPNFYDSLTEAILNRWYPGTIEEAVSSLKDGDRLSITLDGAWSLSLPWCNKQGNGFPLFYHLNIVGELNENVFRVEEHLIYDLMDDLIHFGDFYKWKIESYGS